MERKKITVMHCLFSLRDMSICSEVFVFMWYQFPFRINKYWENGFDPSGRKIFDTQRWSALELSKEGREWDAIVLCVK